MPKSERRSRPRAAARRLPQVLTLGIHAALEKKATDVVALDLRQGTAFTDFFVIATAGNVRQAQAIADGIQEALRAEGIRPALVEGYERAGWILIDYFDAVFHIFTPVNREFYALERLWGDARRIEIPEI